LANCFKKKYMARRKKTKTTHRRRRRMGAMGGIDMKSAGMVMGGAALSTYIINGPMKTTSWINYVMIGGGVFLGKLAPNFAAVGWGLAAGGAISALQNANIISGVSPRMIINGGPPGSFPLSSIAGRRHMGNLPPKAAAAAATRRAAAGNSRVIIGTENHPLSSIASDYDPCDL
jgi:hypothetical protein